MRKLGVFVALLVFLSASQVMAAPNLIGTWEGDGVFATPSGSGFGTGRMTIIINCQQKAPGGAVFSGTLSIDDNPVYDPRGGYALPVTGTTSLTNGIHTNGIHMTVSDGEAIAVLSGQYLGRAINVVLQDLTDQGVTGAFSLKFKKPEQIPEPPPGDQAEEPGPPDKPEEPGPHGPAPAPQR